MDNWTALKTILQEDLEAWSHESNTQKVLYNSSNDIAERNNIQASISVIAIYISVLEHYIDLMNQMEADGGQEPRKVED